MATGSDARLSRVIAVINGKGGAGKTSTTANLGGEMAANGYRVLVVDTDLSGNLGLHLGYVTDEAKNDKGKGIIQAVWGASPLNVIKDVRTNLDAIAGGRALALISKLNTDGDLKADLIGGGAGTAFADALAQVAENYDVVLIDCAPGNPELQEMALTAARYIIIPAKTDPASWDGLRNVGPLVKRTRETNPELRYLGALIFAHSSSATRVMRQTGARLEEVTETVPLFTTYIRHSEAAAHDTVHRSQLARELARDSKTLAKERVAALRQRRKAKLSGDNVIPLPGALGATSGGVAQDYGELAREVLTRIAAIENDEFDQSGVN